MNSYYAVPATSDEIYHHGIIGQKWGVRRYQNPDGSLTAAGKERYGSSSFNGSKGKASKAPSDMIEDVLAVNGGKNGVNKSYLRHNNCAFCSVAYEMRRRGENVRAQEALEGVTTDAIVKAIKNFNEKDVKNFAERTTRQSKSLGMTEKEFDNLTNEILKDGPNSRGQMTVNWKAIGESGLFSGGHALNYEVKDGTFYLVDSQIGKTYSGKKAYNYLSNACNVKTYRTDNKKFDTKITEKYYTESNTGNIVDRTKSNRIANNLAISAGMALGTANLFMFFPIISAPAAVVGLSLAGGSAIAAKKAKKQLEEDTLELEEKWQKEKRTDFYSMSKEKKK